MSSLQEGFNFPWNRVPERVRMAHDPVIALALWVLGLAGTVAVLVSLLPGSFSLKEALPVLGAVVVLLGSYFAARTLRDNELTRATEMLGSDSPAVQLVGIHQLGQIGMYVPKFRKDAQLAICAFLGDSLETGNDVASHRLARKVLSQLTGAKESTVETLDVEVTDVFPRLARSGETSGSGAAPDS